MNGLMKTVKYLKQLTEKPPLVATTKFITMCDQIYGQGIDEGIAFFHNEGRLRELNLLRGINEGKDLDNEGLAALMNEDLPTTSTIGTDEESCLVGGDDFISNRFKNVVK